MSFPLLRLSSRFIGLGGGVLVFRLMVFLARLTNTLQQRYSEVIEEGASIV